MEIPQLSALTPAVVDRLYGLDRAVPSSHPTFLFLVGAPGAGKSTGHAAAIEAGLLPTNRAYVTVDLDRLLEAITPFRAGSAMAHFLKQDHRDLVKFGSIAGYGSRHENLGAFKWYDEAHDELATTDPATIAAFNAVRSVYQPLADATAANTISEHADAALARAIAASVPIVYETTLSVGSGGRVTKVDALMRRLAKTPYQGHIYMWHVTGAIGDIQSRIRARQEYVTPAEDRPFYRYVPTYLAKRFIEDTAAGFAKLQTQYAGKIQFHEIVPPHNATRLPTALPYSLAEQRERIVAAYLPPRLHSSDRVSSPRGSLYVSSPSPGSPLSSPTPSPSSPPRRRPATRRSKKPSPSPSPSSSSSEEAPPPRRATTRKATAAPAEAPRRSSRLKKN